MRFTLGYFTFVGQWLVYVWQILPSIYHKSYRQNATNLTVDFLEKIW